MCLIVVVYDVNLYIIIIVTQRDGFRIVKKQTETDLYGLNLIQLFVNSMSSVLCSASLFCVVPRK